MKLRAAALAASTLLLAACGGGQKTTTTPDPTGNTGGTPAAYPAPKDHALFKPGTSWTFATVMTDSHYDDQDPAADASGMVNATTPGEVTCNVVEVTPIAAGLLSKIECDGELAVGMVDPLAGYWAATDVGLWRVSADLLASGEDPVLDPKDMFLAAQPVPDNRETVLDEEMEHSESIVTRFEDPAWCVEEAYMGGDGAWRTLCLDAMGPTRGNGGWSGGAEQEVTFTRK